MAQVDRPIIFQWDGDAMRPVRSFTRLANDQFVVGQEYRLVQEAGRSKRSHDHFFASVEDAWQNLPERWDGRFPTADHMRKFALIRAGYRDERSIVASSKAEAQRVAAFVKPMDEFAVVVVSEAVVTVYTAKSQSLKAMGREAFQRSKSDVLDVLAKMVGAKAKDFGRAA